MTKHTTIREFITELEAIAAEHGDNLPVFTISRQYEEYQTPSTWVAEGFDYGGGRVEGCNTSGSIAHGPDEPCPDPLTPATEWEPAECNHPAAMGKILTIT